MPRFCRSSLLLPVLIILGACAGRPATETGQPAFQHGFTGTAVPWTKTYFDDDEDRFTFALFSDLTGGERHGVFDVAVSDDGVDIANLHMSGIFDKTGKIPVNGEEICLEQCAEK